jgi:hypothetical protein
MATTRRRLNWPRMNTREDNRDEREYNDDDDDDVRDGVCRWRWDVLLAGCEPQRIK